MAAQVTPMMAQYLEIKARHADALLFYRMGDFYEMFFDDAVAAAEALDIALTKRGKHDGDDIPMCGVPAHSAEGYLLSLIRKGFRVAICEQLEDPSEAKKRGYKAVVKRDVVRVVTPGTLTEDSLLDARRHNYLAAYAEIRGEGGLAWCDISTGDFFVQPCPPVRLGPEVARLQPKEVLVSNTQDRDIIGLLEEIGAVAAPLAPSSFDSQSGTGRIADALGVTSLDAFGSFSRPEIGAMSALIAYLDLTQKGVLPRLRPPRQVSANRIMQIDAATRRNLELTHSLTGGRSNTLLSVIDQTLTAGGARLLEHRISGPSTDLEEIQQRQQAVHEFVSNKRFRDDLRTILRRIPDLDRAMSRLALDRAGPRDLAAVRDAIANAARLAEQMAQAELPPLLANASADLEGHDTLSTHLDEALVAEPPVQLRDGGMIAPGFDADLDEARRFRDEGRGVIGQMQAEYIEATGIPSLKIKHNNVLGYFIETTATHAEKMLSAPLSERFIHRQTTANAVRFTTVDLSELETRILNAGQRAQEIEKRLFEDLRSAILAQSDALGTTARAVAEIDVAAGLAACAGQKDWAQPSLRESRDFVITGGRHPVVEAALARDGTAFVPNDCTLSPQTDSAAITLLTGPNMAGKSTFLRQNALIAILAQIGSFVPATSAEIGLVTQVFSRVGAADDLARGRSTFMVEMVETSAILNQADDRALVILDEIGRGTATYDGLSIAWATLEHLHEVNKSRALFATHYHELTALAANLGGLSNATVAVKEWESEVIFLHEVTPGAADRSYGVQVAKLAGLPRSVIARAQTVLNSLEQGEREGSDRAKLIDDLPLFSVKQAAPAQASTSGPSPVEERLRGVHPDEMTAREALSLLYDLKDLLGPD